MHIQVLGNGAVGQIADLVPVAEVVDDEDIVVTSAVQGPDDVAADKTGPTGHDDHGGAYRARIRA